MNYLECGPVFNTGLGRCEVILLVCVVISFELQNVASALIVRRFQRVGRINCARSLVNKDEIGILEINVKAVITGGEQFYHVLRFAVGRKFITVVKQFAFGQNLAAAHHFFLNVLFSFGIGHGT